MGIISSGRKLFGLYHSIRFFFGLFLAVAAILGMRRREKIPRD